MRSVNILVTLCLNIGFSVSKGTSPCQGVKHGLCGRGQHVVFTEDSQYSCVDCPRGTFLEFHSHSCETCKSHSHPHLREIIIQQGSSTHDNLISCREGFFRRQAQSSEARVGCQKCSICGDGTWEAESCNSDQDRLCCQHGMIAGHVNGHLMCVLPHSRHPRQPETLRRERASGSNEHNSSVLAGDNSDTADTSAHEGSETGDNSDAASGYSRADYETEFRQSKVEFPVWARILCAGIAIGVFLFYLGVGIPCNACGSRDQLRALRNWAFSRNVDITTEEETKEKPAVKPKISSDPV